MPAFSIYIVYVINWIISLISLLLRFPFPALPGLLGFGSGIVIYILELEGTPSLTISSIVPLLGIYYYKSFYKSFILGGEVVDGFIAVINHYNIVLKVYLLLSYSIGKGSGSRGE
jgi:hypothetical protein